MNTKIPVFKTAEEVRAWWESLSEEDKKRLIIKMRRMNELAKKEFQEMFSGQSFTMRHKKRGKE